MIAYLRGRGILKQEEVVILDVAGIGYEVWCPPQVINAIAEGSEQKLYTVYSVREDSHTLYGFLMPAQKELFRLVLGVSGIGPKNALKVIGKVSGDDILRAIAQQDSGILEALGIGKKMADRMIVELKDKRIIGDGSMGGDRMSGGFGDEVEALVGLGYNARDVIDVLKNIRVEGTNERIKEALRILGK